MPVCAASSPLTIHVRMPSMKSSGVSLAAGSASGSQRNGSGPIATPPREPDFRKACGSGSYRSACTEGLRR